MKRFQITTNTSCNLRCTYCYEYLDNRRNNAENIINTFEALFASTDFSEDKDITVDVIGGEPFLLPDMLDEVFHYITVTGKEKFGYEKISFTISTNATLLKHNRQKEVLTKYRDYITLGISIDGTKEKHDLHRVDIHGNGTYDSVIEGYKVAYSILGPSRIQVKATFTKADIPYVSQCLKANMSLEDAPGTINWDFNFEESFDDYDGIKMVHELIDAFRYYHFNEIGQKVEIAKVTNKGNIYLPFIPYHNVKPKPLSEPRCGGVGTTKSIGYNGEVYGCNRFLTMNKPNMTLGKVEVGKYIPGVSEEFKQVMKSHEYVGSYCQSCIVNSSCPDCPAIAIEEGLSLEEFYQQKRMCVVHKAKVIARLYANILTLRGLNRGNISRPVD